MVFNRLLQRSRFQGGRGLFFGVGTGRCGTMSLANALNHHKSVLCLHEGMIRNGTVKGEPVLPFLTLQNNLAYSSPEEADAIFDKFRGKMANAKFDNVNFFGDIAYNYSPFVRSIYQKYPEAKLIFIFRNGIDFVRSAVTAAEPDPCPVGWKADGARLSREERYIALGRLRPSPTNPLHQKWPSMDVIERNSWLWAETNRIILDSLKYWPEKQVLKLRLEDFAKNPIGIVREVLEFLCVPSSFDSVEVPHINSRNLKVLPEWIDWSDFDKHKFVSHAGEVMRRLGYNL